MGIDWMLVLTWVLAVTSGLMAGVYLTFSSFAIRSFDALGPARAVDAMNAINRQILSSLFMPLFFGSTLVAVLLTVMGIWHWHDPHALWAVAAGLCYCIGMFAITAVFNVPLNNQLSRVISDSTEASAMWSEYRVQWTRWNTVRTFACLISFALCLWMLS